MKKTNMAANSPKLQLKKQAIANLSKNEMAQVDGGQAAFTTSYGNCSGFACCHPETGPKPPGDFIVDLIDLTIKFF